MESKIKIVLEVVLKMIILAVTQVLLNKKQILGRKTINLLQYKTIIRMAVIICLLLLIKMM